MNIKKVLSAGLVFAGIAFAQNATPAATPAPAQQPAAPAPAAAPAATPAPQVSTPAATPAAEQSAAPAAEQPAASAAAPVEQASAAAPVAEQPAAPAAEKPAAAAAAPAEQAPAKAGAPKGPGFIPRAKTQFDVLHGNAYNRQSNVAAANNIDLLLRYPNLFANQKFLYVEPSGEMGVASFGNFFSAIDVSGDLGRITLGYAQLGFGFYLRAGVGHVVLESDNAKRYNTTFGDDLGAAVSTTIAGYGVGLSVDWLTTDDETGLEPKYGASYEQRNRDLTANFSVTNSPIADKLFWTAGARYVNHLDEFEAAGKVVPDSSDSYNQVTPYLRLGYVGLQNAHARVIAGLGAMVPLTFHEDYDIQISKKETVTRSLSEYTFLLEPQLLGEVFLNENVMFFGEASYQWIAASYVDGADEGGEDYSRLVSMMNKVDASLGVRLQYQNFAACEFAFGDSFFTDTKSIFNGEGVFISFGAFLYF